MYFLARLSASRTLSIVVSICLIGFSLHILAGSGKWSRQSNTYRPLGFESASYDDDGPVTLESDDLCTAYLDPGNIVLSVKTGATEASEKLPMQLLTMLWCARHVALFSDMEQEIAGHHIYDALDRIPSDKMNHSDFDLYRMQQELRHEGHVDVGKALKGMKDPRWPETLAAWTLDKYKQLHIVERTWELYPNKDWYFFFDADTYVVWPTLLMFIKTMDPTVKSYTGSLSFIDNKPFAHGGSGILLSGASMRELVVEHNGTAAKWDIPFRDECCGDFVLARVLEEYGINMTNVWPIINGETLSTIPFGSVYWCKQVVSLHHVQPSEMMEMNDYEKRRADPRKPLTYAEIYFDIVENSLVSNRDDWDNVSDDKDAKADTYEACKEACDDDKGCLQFSFVGNASQYECKLHETFRIGSKKTPEETKRWRSGWNVERIKAWTKKQPYCNPYKWKI